MNQNTKDSLIWFIEKVKDLAIADMMHIGKPLTEQIIAAADRVQRCLEKDETIL